MLRERRKEKLWEAAKRVERQAAKTEAVGKR